MRFHFLISLLLALRAVAAPAAPTGLTATTLSPNSIRLSWQDNSTDEVSFRIGQRTPPSTLFTLIGSVSANETTVTITELKAASTYEFVVAAEDSAGSLVASNVVTVTTFFLNPPGRIGPERIAEPPGDTELTSGVNPPVIPLAGLFRDPDVGLAARLTTDLGNLDFVFYPGAAPQTVNNFLTYLTRGDYVNSILHRSEPGFVIQGGGYRADATASPIPKEAPVANEPLISNVRGTVAMAKLGGNPNSATSEYFINLSNNIGLNYQNGGFTVFARIAGNGMQVADAIAALPIRDYSAIRSALNNTPVRNGAEAFEAFDPQSLVRVLSSGLIAPLALAASSSNETVVQPGMSGTDLVLSPRAPGTATVTLTATDLDGLTASTSFQVTVTPDTYEKWVARQPFETPGDALAMADPDRDGRVNLEEFAQGSLPLSPSGSDFVGAMDDHRLSVTFPLRPHLAGTSVELESAPSPAGPWTTRWTPADGLEHPWIKSWLEFPDRLILTVQDPSSVVADRNFLRLKLSKP